MNDRIGRETPLLEVRHIEKYYGNHGTATKALDQISFCIQRGEYVSIMGASGSGKTTLLNCISTIDRVSGGHILLDGQDLTTIREDDLAAFRRENLGFVFQDFNLLDTFSLRDNIFLPLVLAGKRYDEMEARLKPLARKLGLTELLAKFPYEVSGGQKQRLALAVNLVADKDIYVFDEATSNIDIESEAIIMDNIKAMRKNKSVIVISHRLANVVPADNIYYMEEGEVKESGSHAQLIAGSGGYAKLFNAQKQLEEGYKEITGVAAEVSV